MRERIAQLQTLAAGDELRLLRDGSAPTSPLAAVTRLRFRSPITAFRAWRMFHRLYANARASPSFLRGEIALTGTTTLINVSIWRDLRGMLLWTGTPEHVAAVHWTYPRATQSWSSYFVLLHASSSARDWDGTIESPQL